MREIEINTLLLSGGGAKVTASVAALEKAYNSPLFFFNLEHICGISAGAFLGLCLVINYSFDEIKAELLNVDVRKLVNIQFSNFLNDWGIESGKILIKWIESLLIKKGISPKITFKELFNLFPVRYTVIAYNINKIDYEFFNHLKSPELSVIDAIRYSINIPMFFTKQLYNGDLIVDAGVINNFPCELFSQDLENVCKKNDLENLLGIQILKHEDYLKDKQIKSLQDYLYRIIEIIQLKLDVKDVEHKYIINIENLNLSSVNFDISDKIIYDLLEYGERCYEEFEKNLIL